MLTVVRYQSGEKPAWILEIEEARATSSGAIGQSEAWACNSWQQDHQHEQQQQQQYLEQQENQQEVEIDNKKHEAEEKSSENARSSDDSVVENEPIAATAPDQQSDETLTSQQQPISADVISPPSHTVQDLCDVTVASQTHQGMEHVTVTRDPQYESPPVSVCSDEMTSHTADITEFSSHHTTDFEVCQSNELTSGDVLTYQQLVTEDQDKRSAASEQRRDEQQPSATSSPPTPPPSSSSSSSPASTATVARQQTALSSNTTPTTVDAADHGRGKKRHNDKSKMNDQSADVRLLFIVRAFYQMSSKN